MHIRYLDEGDAWLDGRRSVPNPAGWYVQVDGDFHSGPFATRDEAEQAAEKIRRGDVDDLPLHEFEED